MIRAVFLAAICLAGSASARADQLWDFIRIDRNYAEQPKWVPHSGKAQVNIKGAHIEILIYLTAIPRGNDSNKLGDPDINISGIIDPDSTIRATCTFLATDRTPSKLVGRFITRTDQEFWGEKRKIVTFKEIVFPHPPNTDFFGFLFKEARDEP